MKKLNLLLLAMLAGIITQAQSLTVSASVVQNVSCYGGSNGLATCSPSGGTAPYTYLWLAGGQTTQQAVHLVAATYTVRVTDHVGNTASASATITQPATPLSITASAKYNSICALQSDSLYASGSGGTIPYSYLWNGPIADISCPTCQNTNAYPYGAAYVVTAVNDANGCTASASVLITVHPLPLVSIAGPLSPVTSFNNDTLIAISPGASSYLWSNSATTSAIIVSPVVTTTYSITTTNMYGCTDTNHYTVTPNSSGNGKTSGTAIVVSPSTNITTISYSSGDSVVWFSFVAADSNNQIIANSNYLSEPVPHVHRLTLYDNSLHMIVDEFMPDIIGANQIRIDISHLHPGSSYYVRASRCPAHANMAGCNPSSAGECNPTQRWDFQMCFRTVPVFVPNDSGNEPPSVSQLYYEHRGQITDLNKIPRFDVKAYTNNTKPAVFCSDSTVSFVYQYLSQKKSAIDTVQRVDMVLTGASVQPSQPVFKMDEDSGAGYLNYFLGFVPNGVPKIEGYSRLVYKNVYPNVDMQVYSNEDGTKFYFVCNPGSGGLPSGNPADIELQFKGASSVSVTGSGGLNVVTELGTLSFAPGFAYTDSLGIIKPKSWQPYFIAVNSNTVKFNTGAYNAAEPLIIRFDRGHKVNIFYPAIANLDWSTYFGGADEQSLFNDVCSDKKGEIYATGSTQSLFYPVTIGVVQDSLSGLNSNSLDACVAKFDTLDKREWATYFGGSDNEFTYGIKTDVSGNIYITGNTLSFDLPAASAPSSPLNYVQSGLASFNGNGNAFIAMFSNNGTKTYWTTYYGGMFGGEQGNHITIDGDTNIYIVGSKVNGAQVSHFPLLKSAKVGSYNDSTYGTGFILEFNASHAFNPAIGITRKWATRIGDTDHLPTSNSLSSVAALYGCTVDASNNFYVTGAAAYGYTSPTTPIYPCNTTAPFVDAVVSKFNSNNQVVWSSYFGGSESDAGYAIDVDQSGNVYIAGNTSSDSVGTDIGIETKKLGTGYFQRHNKDYPGSGNGFIAEFSSSGSPKWGTYFGATGLLYPTSIAIDAFENLYVTGRLVDSIPLPVSNIAGTFSQLGYIQGNSNHIGDAFVAAFSSANSNPDYVWGTYFGGDQATGMCLTHVSNNYWLYVVGNIGSGYTPLVFPAGAYFQNTFFFQLDTLDGSAGTSFISQFNINPIVGPASVSPINSPIGEVSVYPNPTNQNVTVQFNTSQNENVEFMLYNLMGEMVYDKNVSEQAGIINQQINMYQLPNGIYLLKVNEDNKFMTQKIIKQN